MTFLTRLCRDSINCVLCCMANWLISNDDHLAPSVQVDDDIGWLLLYCYDYNKSSEQVSNIKHFYGSLQLQTILDNLEGLTCQYIFNFNSVVH